MNSILTVTSAASTYDLTSLTTVKEELSVTDGADDAMLRRWITEESARVASHCRRVFALETVREVIRFEPYDDRDCVPLSRSPVASLTSVTEDDDTALTTSYYEADLGAGLLYRLDGSSNREWWMCSRLTVVYRAGYTLLTGLPREIEKATIRLIQHRYYARGRDPYLRAQRVRNVLEQQFWVPSANESALPPDVRDMLATFVEHTP